MLKKQYRKQNKLLLLSVSFIIVAVLAVVFFLFVKMASDQNQAGVSYLKLSKKQLGGENYQIYQQSLETLKTDSYNRAALINLGYFYRQVGQYDEAIKALSRHLEIDPYDPEILLALARIHVDQVKYQEAEIYYYKIVDFFPLYMIAYRELLILYQNKTLEPNPQFIEALNKGLSYDEKNQYDADIKQLLQEYNLITKE